MNTGVGERDAGDAAATRASRQRGSASVLVAGVMGVVVLLGCAAVVVAGYLVGYHRARAAADLAALSGAAAYGRGADACAQAGRTAAANGAEVSSCTVVGDVVDYVVSVTASVPVARRLPGLPTRLRAEAHAEPVVTPTGVGQ